MSFLRPCASKASVRPLTLGSLAACLLASPVLAASEPGAADLRLEPVAPTSLGSQSQSQQLIAQSYGSGPASVDFAQADGWYLTIGAGASKPSNSNWSLNNPASLGLSGASGNFDYGGGFAADGGIGYDFGRIRTELTYSYNRASLNQINGQFNGVGFSSNNVAGAVNKNDVFASAYLDFPAGRWTPYIGGGIGYTNLSTPSLNFGGVSSGSANRGLFGWQAKAGIAYGLSYNWDIYAEGVYQGAGSSTIPLLNSTINSGSFNNWGGKIGFRYRFAQPPAPVVVEQPAPAPAPAPTYTPMPEPAPAPAPVRGLW